MRKEALEVGGDGARVCMASVLGCSDGTLPPPPLHQLGPVRFKYFIVSPGKAFIYKARVFHSA